MRLDELDKRILRALQRDGRLQNVELAREVGLSPSPCLRRVKLLEEAGIIDRYVAVLKPEKVGLPLSMFARVWLTAQDAETIDHFMEAMKKLPQVLECYIMLSIECTVGNSKRRCTDTMATCKHTIHRSARSPEH